MALKSAFYTLFYTGVDGVNKEIRWFLLQNLTMTAAFSMKPLFRVC